MHGFQSLSCSKKLLPLCNFRDGKSQTKGVHYAVLMQKSTYWIQILEQKNVPTYFL